MKRVKWLLAAIVAIVLVFAGFLAWILYAPSGAGFVIRTVSSLVAPVRISYASFEGRLATGLTVRRFSLTTPETEISAGVVHFSLSPLGLLLGRIASPALSAPDVSIIDRSPGGKPIDLTWPHVTGFPVLLTVEIGKLEIGHVSYRREGEKPLLAGPVSGHVTWAGGRLTVRDLNASLMDATVTGYAGAGFARPFLESSLEIVPEKAPAGIKKMALKADLKGAKGSGELAGTLAASGEAAGRHLSLDASIALFSHRIDVRRLTFSPGAGRVTAEGSVSFETPVASFRAAVNLEGLHLEALGLGQEILSGRVASSGTSERYSGNFTLENSARNWRAFKASGDFQGSAAGVAIEKMAASWLGGKVSGSSTLEWKEGLRVSAEIKARGLDPGSIDATWRGRVNTDLDLVFTRAPGGSSRTTLHATLLESTFRGRPLTGLVSGDIEAGEVRVRALELHGRGFDVSASGALTQGIAFRADIRDMSALVPSASGRLAAHGTIRYRDAKAGVSLDGKGDSLAYGDLRIPRLRLAVAFDQTGNEALDVRLETEGISYGEAHLRRAELLASGTVSRHTIRLSGTGTVTEGNAVLTGGYGNGVWQGRLQSLRATEGGGKTWNLASPAGLEVSRERLRVEPFTVAAAGGEKVSGRADLALKPRDGGVDLSWERLDPSFLDPFIHASIRGQTGGAVTARWRKGKISALSGNAAFSGSIEYEGAALAVSESRTEIDWTGKGLEGSWSLKLGQGGSLYGRLSSPSPPRLSLPPEGRLTAAWEDFSLAALSPFLTETLTLTGLSSGEAALALLPGKSFAATARLSAKDGVVKMIAGGVETAVPFDRVSAYADWRQEVLKGRITVDAGRTGAADADFTLPVPARLPLTLLKRGEIAVSAKTSMGRLDLLSPLAPSALRDLKGRLEASMNGRGTWDRPVFSGRFRLSEAGARLGETGARLADVAASGRVAWESRGLEASIESTLGAGGTVTARVASPEPAHMGIPGSANVDADWKSIDVGLAAPFLPEGIRAEGRISGSLAAKLLPGERLAASVRTVLDGGTSVAWSRKGQGVVKVAVRTAVARADWSKERLSGEASVELAEYGRVTAAFALPVRASLHAEPIPSAPLKVTVTGQLREQGLVTALLPGLVEETKGRVEFDVGITGTWAEPRLGGSASLADAGAYLPAAGIRLRNLGVRLDFVGDTIRIVDLKAESGPGTVAGSGQIGLAHWKVTGYEGKLAGEKFEAAHLPDLRLLLSPDIRIKGTGKRLSVQGEVLVPRLHIYGPPTADVVTASPDVVIVNAAPKARRELPFAFSASVMVKLGDDVQVKMRDIDAKLGGGAHVRMTGLENVSAKGQINVIKGSYAAYGLTLNLARGQIVLDGPPERASLDILAVRQIKNANLQQAPAEMTSPASGQVGGLTTGVSQPQSATSEDYAETGTLTVGVHITGTVQNPVINLYSQPQLPDTEVLSYIVFGRPLGGSAAQAGVLMTAAGALLSRGQSASLQDRLKNTLGLETLEVKTSEGGTENTMLSLGKYLAPHLYVGFARSLFAGDYVFVARYGLTKNWEIRTTTGGQSGADIYYKILFD